MSPDHKAPYDRQEFERYLQSIIHSWMTTLGALGFVMISLFFILDSFLMPAALLPRFAVYRGVTVALLLAQHIVLRRTEPSHLSQWHGYGFAVLTSTMLTVMTAELGGFSSTYYAGINLVIIGVVMTVPWNLRQSLAIPAICIGVYVTVNLLVPQPIATADLVNNLFFLGGTSVIIIATAHIKLRLMENQFIARKDLAATRDALWAEVEVAKKIQTSLLPRVHQVPGYLLAATMEPAAEVGGDYYDIIETDAGEVWLCIGDVSGHGVESGLIMMMTQTSIYTTINRTPGYQPSRVLDLVNSVLRTNITRLGTDHYMTISTVLLGQDQITFAGKHQDFLIHRRRTATTEILPTRGTWLGIIDDLSGQLEDTRAKIEDGDILLLFTNGITKATNAEGEMFGEERLKQALSRYADLGVDDIVSQITTDVFAFMCQQEDDFTLLAIQRAG